MSLIKKLVRQRQILLAMLIVIAGCSSKIDYETSIGSASSNVEKVTVDRLDILVAKPGEMIAVLGSNLRPDLAVMVGGVAAALEVESSEKARFKMPQGVRAGLVDVGFTFRADAIATLPLVSDSAADGLPIVVASADFVCKGSRYRDAKGEAREGTRECAALADCKLDGQVNCRANEHVKAAIIADLATKVAVGKTVAGVAGTLPLRPANCGSDGDVGCVVAAPFTAVAANTINPGDVRVGKTLGGIAGSLVVPVIADVRVGTSYGAAGALIGTLDPSASTPTCASDGDINCVVSPGYAAAMLTGLADKVLSTATVAGVLGNVTLPLAADVRASVNFGVAGTSRMGTLSLPAVGDVFAGVTYGVVGSASTGTLTLPSATNVRSAQGAFGRSGNSITPSLADCAADGASGCVATATFKAANMAFVTAGNIKRGVTLGGVTGGYPSSDFPLVRYASSNAADATAAADGGITTSLTNFASQLATAGSFEFWDAHGVRRTGSGDTDIVDANIKSGVAFENVSVTGSFGPACTSDGSTGCVTSARYKSMDTDSSVIGPWDIRKGKTAGGVQGEIVFYKNMADLTAFNRTAGTGALAGLDIFDTVEDFSLGHSMPSQSPGGWPQLTGVHWQRDGQSDTGVGGGTAADGSCNGSEDCVYTDALTKLAWARVSATQFTWEGAIDHCDSLNASNFGGYSSGWRLPTQKELMQAYVNGVWGLNGSDKLDIPTMYVWSSSTDSNTNTNAWYVYLTSGGAHYDAKSQTAGAFCVH